MTDDIRELVERLREAADRVIQSCMGPPSERPALVSIPANPSRDVDIVIQEAADALESLSARLEAAEKVVEAAYREGFHNGMDPNISLEEAAWKHSKTRAALTEQGADEGCSHDWTDARNEIVQDGEICLKCGAVRPGNTSVERTGESDGE